MYSCSTTAKVKSPSVIKFTFLAFQFFRVSPVTANPNSAVPLFVPVQTRNAVSDLTGATSEVAGHNIAVREADIEHRDMKGFTPLILAPPCLWPVAGAVKDECNRWSYIQINSDIRPLRHRILQVAVKDAEGFARKRLLTKTWRTTSAAKNMMIPGIFNVLYVQLLICLCSFINLFMFIY